MKEDIIVVDEEDNIIDHLPRKVVDERNLRYRVSGLWVKNPKGEHLLARRAMTKTHDPGKWGPAVAGTVEKGETYESNIVKEAEEEIGLTEVEFTLGPKVKRQTKHRYFCQWFIAVVDRPASEFSIQEEEVDEIKWFSTDELRERAKNYPDEFLKGVDKWLEEFADE